MLRSLIKNIGRREISAQPAPATNDKPIRLHIGGQIAHADWKIFDVVPGPNVDFVGHCTDLSRFGDASIAEIYASHVLEHLGYQSELPAALKEIHRVLVRGGMLRASVPDLTTLCSLFLQDGLQFEERFHVMRMMYGGQLNDADFHYVGLSEAFLVEFLKRAGFAEIVRVENFGLFDDASSLLVKGRAISLNLLARRSP